MGVWRLNREQGGGGGGEHCCLSANLRIAIFNWEMVFNRLLGNGLPVDFTMCTEKAYFPVCYYLWNKYLDNEVGGRQCCSLTLFSCLIAACSPCLWFLSYHCVTRAPVLNFIRSWVALSFICESVRHEWHPSRSPLCAIYKGIDALYWPSIINYS